MEEEKRKEPRVEIQCTHILEDKVDEYFNYVVINLDDWNYYVWSCRKFEPILMESDGAIVKDAEAKISDLLSTIRGRDKNVARKKQIIEKKQLHTEKVLEQTINDCLKDLMKIINIKLMRDQMSSKLWIDRQESDEE